ncbi:MAG: cation/H(+) antiporter [Rickettsiales bacterium]|nr:cation/H(+) antiporter [Rickettsiales bacterium]|tara:strand:+ start:11935 stop:13221 length:1287 start_codon:yes stop_codon:yes gene_type:complete
MHSTGSLTIIALVGFVALVSGYLFTRIRQPAVVGYVIAGLILGPSGFSLIENREMVSFMAELGVLLLLFILGLEMNLRTFREIWKIALGCVALQVTSAVIMMTGAAFIFNFSVGTTLLIGFITALSSTAASVSILENIGELKSTAGKLTIGILIAQDIAFVPMTLILKSFGGAGGFSILTIMKMIIAIGALVVIIVYLSKKERVRIPFIDAVGKRKELYPLMGLAFCFLAAALSGFLEISAAYGAFVAGLVLGNSADRHAVIKATQPTQSILLMTFFLSVGMLLDLGYLAENWLKVLILLSMIFVVKTVLNTMFLKHFGQPVETALLSSLVLAQIGEFSFVLTTIGLDQKLLDPAGGNLVICLTVLSLVLSPIWMIGAQRLCKMGVVSTNQPDSTVQSFFASVYRPELGWIKKQASMVYEAARKIINR